jgi:tRNA pseudouridine38-40 synthase
MSEAAGDGRRLMAAMHAESASPMRLRIDLAYLGSPFHGWQIQPDLRTVQGEMRRACSRLLGRDACPIGAGRTDAGVHARGQVCHLDVITPREAERVSRKLAALLPREIQVKGILPVSPAFDARLSATSRRYSYHLLRRRDVFREPYALYLPGPLDREALAAAAVHFLGTHDFTSFCKRDSLKPDDNTCRVELCRFHWEEDSTIFHVRANRFLHHMVRNLVGTLVEVGRGRRSAADMPALLAARDRTRAGRKAPAHALFLEEVSYPEELLDPAYRPAAGAPAGDESRGDMS